MINLKDLEHFRNNPMVQFKEETVGGVEVVIPCYMIANDDLWKQPLATELRGHVFRKDTGECISMAFHKFFNINEKEDTLVENIDWTKPFSVMEKCDGSMITAVVINDEVYFKTKKSFYSDVAILANQYATEEIKSFVKSCLENQISPIFEFTHPNWKIVVDYGQEPTWTLIGIRYMDSDFAYVDLHANEYINSHPDIKIPKQFHFVESSNVYDEIKNTIDTMEGMEGYVITFQDGSRYKTKCNWYLLRHRVNTDLRERDVVKMIHDETIDDIKSVIVEAGHSLDKIAEIENRYSDEYMAIVEATGLLYSKFKDEPDRKSIALKYCKDEFFKLAIQVLDEKVPDFKGYWEKKHLKEYSLRTVYSDFNHEEKL